MSKRCYDIIEKYYADNPQLKELYLVHVELVRDKATEIAKSKTDLNPDIDFISEASLLHDIGIFRTSAPSLFCTGEAHYLEHGYLGREILESEELPLHGLVAERHTGSGISEKEIITRNLPLPKRDMLPTSIEEKIICYADCFFSKDPTKLTYKKSIDEIREGLLKFGQVSVDRFNALHDLLCKDSESLFK